MNLDLRRESGLGDKSGNHQLQMSSSQDGLDFLQRK